MNIVKMMQQAKKMQADMQKKMEEHDKKEFIIEYNGLVSIKILGSLEVKEINILKDDLIDKDDPETLQDVIMSATNKAISEVLAEKEKITKDLVPGGLPF